MTTVQRLWDTDPVFRSMTHAFGAETADDVLSMLGPFSKFSPGPSDVHAATAVLSARPRARKRVVRKAANKLALGLGAAGAYTAASTVSPEGTFRRIKATNRTIGQGAQQAYYARAARKAQRQAVAAASEPLPASVAKTDEVVWDATISKVDAEKRQVFGWASVATINGKPVVDRQGDLIDPDEMEKSAYEYVIKSRKGGDQHRRTDDGQAFHASDLIESFVVTEEKKQKLGLPDELPIGWWVGFKVGDDQTWDDVRTGKKTGFSIHGKGRREPVTGVFDPVSVDVRG